MTTDRRSKTVAGRQYPSVVKSDRYVLADDADPVYPGMLLEVTGVTDQGYFEVQPNSRAGENVPLIFAEVRAHPPRGDQTRTYRKNQPYEEPGEMVEAVHFRPGDTTDNAFLAAEEVAAPGEALVADNAGGLTVHVDEEEGAKLCEAQEDVEAPADDEARIEVIF
ncbi:hypothetical protein [Natrarchaeobaculum sulfurireducens]|uniref:Uncharacterized protein n=1 Tax=Natrarchaeobaculum sulfurireducens TaxID=2044521 RepID=A0A346PMP8_9EURY|nr:hypothetical protein [Natrarchaeobaculum sulfurireducens]AXR80793.1 hypothetical protein AArcMg_0771 [Natrarchaeobaculum sulfurireducens]